MFSTLLPVLLFTQANRKDKATNKIFFIEFEILGILKDAFVSVQFSEKSVIEVN